MVVHCSIDITIYNNNKMYKTYLENIHIIIKDNTVSINVSVQHSVYKIFPQTIVYVDLIGFLHNTALKSNLTGLSFVIFD